MNHWDSTLYLKFKAQRTQPSIDLIHRIPLIHPKQIVDIGCGPGNSTQALYHRFPDAGILGVDSSPEMVQSAKANLPELEFQLCDASKELGKLDKKYDVVFSNACIQWIPDHPVLLKEMFSLLQPGGVLALQVPMNYQEPIHQILTQLVQSERWRDRLSQKQFFHTLTQEEYFDLLAAHTADFELWQTTYLHRMPSHNSIIEWYRGTGMRPYLTQLSTEEQAVFEQEVYQRIVEAYPKQKNGEIIFRFPRLFFIAKR